MGLFTPEPLSAQFLSEVWHFLYIKTEYVCSDLTFESHNQLIKSRAAHPAKTLWNREIKDVAARNGTKLHEIVSGQRELSHGGRVHRERIGSFERQRWRKGTFPCHRRGGLNQGSFLKMWSISGEQRMVRIEPLMSRPIDRLHIFLGTKWTNKHIMTVAWARDRRQMFS